MSQKVTPKEISQKPEFFSQDRNNSQAREAIFTSDPFKKAILVLSQGGTAKSQMQVQSQDRAPSQVNDSQESCVPSQQQVLVQSQIATQKNVSTQASVPSKDAASQATVPTLSQLSQTQAPNWSSKFLPPIQNNATPYSSQKQSQCDEKENINQLETTNASSGAPSQNSQSQDLNKSCWLLKSGQSDSQGRGYLESCTQILVDAENPNKPKNNE